MAPGRLRGRPAERRRDAGGGEVPDLGVAPGELGQDRLEPGRALERELDLDRDPSPRRSRAPRRAGGARRAPGRRGAFASVRSHSQSPEARARARPAGGRRSPPAGGAASPGFGRDRAEGRLDDARALAGQPEERGPVPDQRVALDPAGAPPAVAQAACRSRSPPRRRRASWGTVRACCSPTKPRSSASRSQKRTVPVSRRRRRPDGALPSVPSLTRRRRLRQPAERRYSLSAVLVGFVVSVKIEFVSRGCRWACGRPGGLVQALWAAVLSTERHVHGRCWGRGVMSGFLPGGDAGFDVGGVCLAGCVGPIGRRW